MRRTYVGIIQNDLWDVKTLVLAESADAARARVLDKLGDRLRNTCREEDLHIIPFGDWMA